MKSTNHVSILTGTSEKNACAHSKPLFATSSSQRGVDLPHSGSFCSFQIRVRWEKQAWHIAIIRKIYRSVLRAGTLIEKWMLMLVWLTKYTHVILHQLADQFLA